MSIAAIAVLVLLAIVAFFVIGFVLELLFWAVVAVAVILGTLWLIARFRPS